MFNYPNKKNSFTSSINYSNRGMQLEEDINYANNYYLKNNIAVIHKKPTPIQVVEVDYPKRSKAYIKKAYYKVASTTDYNGVFRGRYIDFEAKETMSKTSFSISNIHSHQFDHMEKVYNQKGIVFIIVRFKSLNRTFILPYKYLVNFYNRSKEGGRKSISLSEFIEYSFEIYFEYNIRIDYLRILIENESEFINEKI
ncbi:Holliday junction resolvase RecU [Gemelliphila palaticanis]|uniref:Holliday junction resolvase RecU n=1 Tax=Gemelliphila palaticanis TaxID=81950 RepID=A0ABX2SX55_9BACL|nr:Holliday junction resolvase RecU [Gemella palaticanis]MBF0714780.1 Holliday junction resolvase RecU [Gemella palaticanis]NYS46710.1 Holliday junction resolvase RecU [Gemella palaticanis]